jgi:hypothetical protein
MLRNDGQEYLEHTSQITTTHGGVIRGCNFDRFLGAYQERGRYQPQPKEQCNATTSVNENFNFSGEILDADFRLDE